MAGIETKSSELGSRGLESSQIIFASISGIKNIIGSLSFHYFRLTVVFEETVEEFVFVVPGEFVQYFDSKYSESGQQIDETKIGRILKNKFPERYDGNDFDRVAYHEEISYKELDDELSDTVELIILDAYDFPEGLDLIMNEEIIVNPAEDNDAGLINQAFNAVMSDSPEDFREIIERIHPQNFSRMLNFIPRDDDDIPFARAIFDSENPIVFDPFTYVSLIEVEEDNDIEPEEFERLQNVRRENIKRFILNVLKYSIYFKQYDITLKIINRFANTKSNVPYVEYFLNYIYDLIGTDIRNYLPEELKLVNLLKDKIDFHKF